MNPKEIVNMVMAGYKVAELSIEEFAKQIEDKIKKIFPKSLVQVSVQKSLGSPSILIQFALGKDRSEWANGIMMNDPLHHQIWIHDYEKSLPDKLKTDLSVGGNIILKENDESGFRSKSIKIGFRSAKGTPEKILRSIENYFKKAKSVIKEYKDRVRDPELIKDKV